MTDIKVRIRDNGPLVVEGLQQLFDAEGNAIAIPAEKPVVALCRCGASAKKPFCDGAHKAAGFESVIRATPPS